MGRPHYKKILKEISNSVKRHLEDTFTFCENLKVVYSMPKGFFPTSHQAALHKTEECIKLQ